MNRDQMEAEPVNPPSPNQDLKDRSTAEDPMAAEMRAIVNFVRENYGTGGRGAAGIEKLLNNCLTIACTHELLQVLREVLEDAVSTGQDLAAVLVCYRGLQLNASDPSTPFDKSMVQAVVKLREVLEMHGSRDSVNFFFRECIQLARQGFESEAVSFYVNIVCAEAKCSTDREPFFDIFGELADDCRSLRQLGLIPSALKSLDALAIDCFNKGESAVRHLNLLVDALNVAANSLPGRGASEVLTLSARFIEVAGVRFLPDHLEGLSLLISQNAPPELKELHFKAGMLAAKLEDRTLQKRVASSLSALIPREYNPQAITNLLARIDEGDFREGGAELVKELNLIAADTFAVEYLTEGQKGRSSLNPDFIISPSARDYKKMQDSLVRHVRLAEPERSKDQPIELTLLEKSVYLGSRDLAHGFSADLFTSKRTPTREAPQIVRFARDVAEVKYVNAMSHNEFPGKGFLIKNFELDRIFARDPSAEARGEDPFAAYLEAWPQLAPDFYNFSKAEILYTRGMKVISCRAKTGFSLTFPDGSEEQMCLVVFNDHFKNNRSRGAYLIPTRLMSNYLAVSLIPGDDFRGYESSRPDINALITAPDVLLNHPEFKHKIMRLDDPDSLIFGLKALQDGRAAEGAYQKLVSKKTEEYRKQLFKQRDFVRRWDRKGHFYHISAAGRRYYLNKVVPLMDETKRMRSELITLQYAAQENDDRIQSLRAEQQRQGWVVANRLLNLNQIFFIAQSYWERGYTQGAFSSSESFQAESGQELEFSQDEQVFWNRNATRMLRLAYEWHSQREAGIEDRDQYPILVATNARKQSEVIRNIMSLDSYDMTMKLKGHIIQLTQGAMDADDELFWHTRVLPELLDQPGLIISIRPYPRKSLDI